MRVQNMSKGELVIIGAGSAGIAAASTAAERGARVILIEQERLGGTCLQRGCVPMVLHLQSARLRENQVVGSEWGVGSTPEEVDWVTLHSHQDRVVNQLTQGTAAHLEQMGVTVLKAHAHYQADHQWLLTFKDGHEESLMAHLVILAQGTHFVLPSIEGIDDTGVWTTDHALGMVRQPDSVLVYGGGFIGVEWAQFLQTMGSRVIFVTPESSLLPGEDDDINAALEFLLQEQHIEIQTSWHLHRLIRREGITMAYGATDSFEIERVLLGDCRRPWGGGLDIPSLSLDANGAVMVDAYQRTSVMDIYAAGDITGGRMLSHWARAQGIIAAQNALGLSVPFVPNLCPRVYHTHPEIAAVGLTESEAKKLGSVVVGQSDLGMNARALTLGENLGFVKIVALQPHGKVVGVHMIGPLASEVIAQAALGLRLEALAEDLAGIVQGHPTLAEALADAAREVVRQL